MISYPILKAFFVSGSFCLSIFLFISQLLPILQQLKISNKNSPLVCPPLHLVLKRLISIFLQAKVHQNFIPRLAHALIFFSFLAFQLHTLHLILLTCLPFHQFSQILWPGLYSASIEILGFGALMSIAYGLIRRLWIRPKYLPLTRDGLRVLLLTGILLISFFIHQTFNLSKIQAFSISFPISSILATALSSSDLYLTTWIRESFLFIHLGSIFYFLASLPRSKHLHILFAPINILFAPVNKFSNVNKLDLDDSSKTSYGINDKNDLNPTHILNALSCTECGRCDEACPAYRAEKDLSPLTLLQQVRINIQQKEDCTPFSKIALPHANDIWACTSCGACNEICPVSNKPMELVLGMRQSRTLMNNSTPNSLQISFNNFEYYGDPWGLGQHQRNEWYKGLNIPTMRENPKAEILLFVGCMGSLEEKGIQTSRSMVSLLKKANINFAILGPEERCTGDLARRTGHEHLAQAMIHTNIQTLDKYRHSRIVTTCAHCLNSLKNEYPQFGRHYKVSHHSEFLNELLETKRLHPKSSSETKVTYHDPCYLSRSNHITEAPRNIIAKLPHTREFQMKQTKKASTCCGAGGGALLSDTRNSERIPTMRLEDAKQSGATTIATACPFCTRMLCDAKADPEEIQVTDIAVLLDQDCS